ncbi:MAG: hypothetical protein R3277_08660 [Brumimicrobium sp.]|nr:hypothetical protein [Brumimicrobium sp.]
MNKILNVIIGVGVIGFCSLLIAVLANNTAILVLFPFIVLSFMIGISAGVIKVFRNNSDLSRAVNVAILFLCVTPVIIPLYGLIDTHQVEDSWPFMMAGIVFQVAVGLLSITGMFSMYNRPHFLTRITMYVVGFILAFWFVIILLKPSNKEIYSYSLVLGALATFLYILALVNEAVRLRKP